jgi:hypothetical protein
MEIENDEATGKINKRPIDLRGIVNVIVFGWTTPDGGNSLSVVFWTTTGRCSWEGDGVETCHENVRSMLPQASLLPEYPETLEIVSRAFRNRGSKECTSYLDSIVQNYDRLPDHGPDVSVFMHADGPYNHTPLQTAADLARTTSSARGAQWHDSEWTVTARGLRAVLIATRRGPLQ